MNGEHGSGWRAALPAGILGFLVATGLALAGHFISTTLYKGKLAANTVTVKGFAERDVEADLALWQISYSVTGGDLASLYAKSRDDEAALTGFLVKQGFAKEDVRAGSVQITDLLANEYRSNAVMPEERYILKNTITVRSRDVGLVDRSTHALDDLVRQGIVLTSNSVDFQFTRLNAIKAEMLRAATKNARDAAQQFANDADSSVGSIQTANQGFFSIVSRDAGAAAAQNPEGGGEANQQQSTIDKKVRVVVTLTYYLER